MNDFVARASCPSFFARTSRPRASHPRRGVVLPIVLVLIGLLAVTMAGFLFFVRAETSGMLAVRDGQQCRLAAESGLEEAVAYLRASPHDPTVWYDVPQKFRHALVAAETYTRENDPVRKLGSRKEMMDGADAITPAWRYSLVAPNYSGPTGTMRYGLTPESAKLNLNTATDEQITNLLVPLLTELRVENAAEYVAALLDWRDSDDEVRDGGAEKEYYNGLTPAYSPKNGPLDTVEELMLIKGFSAAVLWGEDTNRNGILDTNEDDGAASFPEYDNADGVLNNGLAPFLTTFSREPDTALDNKPRISLLADAATIGAQIAANIPEGELSEATIGWLLGLKNGGFNFGQLRSPAELYRPPGVTYGSAPPEGEPAGESGGAGEKGGSGGKSGTNQNRDFGSDGAKQTPPKDESAGDDTPSQEDLLRQTIEQLTQGRPPRGTGPQGGDPASQPSGGADLSPLDGSPVALEELPALLDRFTTRTATPQGIPGLFNINAAPARVLMLIPGMTPDLAASIEATRRQLDAKTLRTTAWPLTTGLVDVETFYGIAPYITTKAYQYHVEALGYADHAKISRRYEWVIEMIGPLAQIRYYRDLTALGPAWPIDDDGAIAIQR